MVKFLCAEKDNQKKAFNEEGKPKSTYEIEEG